LSSHSVSGRRGQNRSRRKALGPAVTTALDEPIRRVLTWAGSSSVAVDSPSCRDLCRSGTMAKRKVAVTTSERGGNGSGRPTVRRRIRQ
jgi:hypothetical protein